MSKEELLALESLLPALRKGRLTPQAIEGLCKGSAHFSELGEAFQRGDVDVAYLEELLAKVRPFDWPLSADQERARDIMGQSFVSPSVFCLAMRNRVRFTDKELAAFAVIPWSEKVLAEELEHQAILYPVRESVTLPCLREVYGTDPESQPCFWKENKWWLGKDGNPFRDRGLPVGWRLVRTAFEPDSTSKTWDEQGKLIPDTHRRTTALEVGIACPLVFRTQGGKRTLEASYAWCEDEDADSRRVRLGVFDRCGLYVDASHPGNSWRTLGLLLSRK